MRRVLLDMMARARDHLRPRLEGLSDREFFWEPVPGSWTVHRRRPEDRFWAPGIERFVNGKGEWVTDYALPDPDPPPFTTVAWRLFHISHINAMYNEHVFGPAKLGFDDFDIPHAAAEAVAWWEESFETYRAAVEGAGDQDMDRIVHAIWGPTLSVREWTEVLIHENIHHGAEIGCLRDLYHHLNPITAPDATVPPGDPGTGPPPLPPSPPPASTRDHARPPTTDPRSATAR